ncbi:MAG: squalene--hopene cyclase [Verrucomicrobia bacterium]|nr:squalene--hopene cyclase [Verrucomicrobiota bacterium]
MAARLEAALTKARRELLDARAPGGHWIGELSCSALSTATAVCALAVVDKYSARQAPRFMRFIERGLDWLAEHQNADGGWGDTTGSVSNISTTTLCWAAFGIAAGESRNYRGAVDRAECWISNRAGSTQPAQLVPAVIRRYGTDRTFSVPILTTCALAGRLGPAPEAWRWVLQLPFELAACPHQWFAALRLPVVSYALPALIAIGQARHHHLPSRNPAARLCRSLARSRTLDVLTSIQPESGGFLEATPLTSFVAMSLAGAGQVEHPVTTKAVEFLITTARPDGSWPIDTNLATWVTTLSVNALCGTTLAGATSLALDGRRSLREWLVAQQYRKEHPYTHAAPGGWAWTDLPGGVPDADDTAGALLALRRLDEIDDRTRAAARAGVKWLLDLQNRDGGIPTFCRGWGALPFDRSSPDLTAHTLRAWAAWRGELAAEMQSQIDRASARAVRYLARTQREDGSWVPLWFGNQSAPEDENPTYGTSRVAIALQELAKHGMRLDKSPLRKAVQWLVKAQNAEGGWSGFAGGPASIEETALALEALGSVTAENGTGETAEESRALQSALLRGALWLTRQVEDGNWKNPSPIGFYFAKLWYFEKLYPMIFTVAALSRLKRSVILTPKSTTLSCAATLALGELPPQPK